MLRRQNHHTVGMTCGEGHEKNLELKEEVKNQGNCQKILCALSNLNEIKACKNQAPLTCLSDH